MNVQLDSRATESGKIATIVYDRQSKLNSLNGAGIKELQAAFQNVAKDTELRGLIFTGAGPKSFIGGADIESLPSQLSGQVLVKLAMLCKGYAVPTRSGSIDTTIAPWFNE